MRRASTAPAIHLGVLLDVSESMGDDIRFTRTAAIKFLNTLTDAVDVTVVDFDTEVRAARYSQNEFARLVERIRQQKTTGMTALYDAIGLYLDGAAAQDGRKVMLLYTDGGDTQSSLRFNELVDLLKASDVTVYAIGALEHQSGVGARAGAIDSADDRRDHRRPGVLPQLGQGARSDVREGRGRDPRAVHDRLRVDQRRTDGAWRKVEIKSTAKDSRDLNVRARKGYFAPYRP